MLNWVYTESDAASTPIETCRGVFVPTSKAKRAWRGSWIYEEAHIQIRVRNPQNILALWHVRPDGRYGKGPENDQEAPAKKVRNGYSQGGIAATLHSIDERLKAMTPEEFRASLVRAGIIGKDGKLTPPYARPKKKKS